MNTKLAEKAQSQKPRRALIIVALRAAIERRALDELLQRSQPALACRPKSSFSVRRLRNRREENNTEKKSMKRGREQLNDRPMLHG